MNFKRIPIQNADNTELLRISQDGLLSLNLTEMQAIQSHFAGISRDPTDVEIETLAQTWSEHCVHIAGVAGSNPAMPTREPLLAEAFLLSMAGDKR